MKKYLNKELITKVGSVCEETPDDNPCAGSEVFLAFIFNKKEVKIFEKQISTCGKAFVSDIGIYSWKLLSNKEIRINFIPEQTKDSYAEHLFLELRNKQLIGRIKHLNGKIEAHVFEAKNAD